VAYGIGNLFDVSNVAARLNRIPVFSQRSAAIPCDTTPTLRPGKSANNRKSKGYSGCGGSPHNLKVVGSNPTPATKILNTIKDFKAEHNARLSSLQFLVNTWSTFYEAPIDGADNRRHGRHSTKS
jgi:hypothetical protein